MVSSFAEIQVKRKAVDCLLFLETYRKVSSKVAGMTAGPHILDSSKPSLGHEVRTFRMECTAALLRMSASASNGNVTI